MKNIKYFIFSLKHFYFFVDWNLESCSNTDLLLLHNEKAKGYTQKIFAKKDLKKLKRIAPNYKFNLVKIVELKTGEKYINIIES